MCFWKNSIQNTKKKQHFLISFQKKKKKKGEQIQKIKNMPIMMLAEFKN